MNLKKSTLLTLFFCFSIGSNLVAQEWMEENRTPEENPNFKEIISQFNTYWKDKEVGRGKGYKPVKRWEYQWGPRVNEEGFFPSAGSHYSAFSNYLKANDLESRSSMTSWESLGPSSNT